MKRAQRRGSATSSMSRSNCAVEHAAGDADGPARGGHVRRQAAAQVQRQRGSAEPLLQQDEAAVFADVAAGLVALEQQAVDEIQGCDASVGRAYLGKHLHASLAQLDGIGGA